MPQDNMSEDQRLQIGQRLWYVPSGRRKYTEPYEVTVTKIGRKWATIDIRGVEDRVDMRTLIVNGGGFTSPGTCWLSKEAYEASLVIEKAWGELRELIERQWRAPKGVSLSQIENARRALFKEQSS